MVTKPRSTRRAYGWRPDLPDHRDHRYGMVRKIPTALPPAVDLSPFCSPVEDQGQLGSCTGNALVGALEYLEKKDGTSSDVFQDFSRLFVYYNERVLEGTVKQDAGAAIRDGVKVLAKLGVCNETTWPYAIRQFARKPPKRAFGEAKKHRIAEYQRLETVDECRACLAEGFPFVFGFTVYESFESQAVAKTGVVNLPGNDERSIGGHAVLGVGYHHRSKRFIVRNSWGSDWGKKGYFTMPYFYLANRNLSDDFWTIRR